MGFLNTNSMPRLVEKLSDGDNIKITGNSKGNRVGTVIKKIVEKADDVTKAVEQEVVNDSYSFKIGTGDVNVSADVQDGFGEIGIKGVVYQNLWFGTVNSANITNRVYSPPEYRGECSANSDCGFTIDTDMIKPNVDYTVVFDVKCEVVGILPKVMLFDKGTLSNPKSFNLTNIDATTFKTIVLKIRTDKNGCKILVGFNAGGQEVKGAQMVVKNIIILEGDHTNNPNLPSYFEGIVGVGDKSKNLFNYKLHDSIEYNGSYYTTTKERWRSNVVEYTVEPNTDYTISIDRYEGNLWFNFEVDGVQFNNNNYAKFSKVIRTNETGKLLLKVGANGTADVGHKFINLQLEKGTVATTYEPYHDGHKIEILSNGKNLFSNKDNFITGGSGFAQAIGESVTLSSIGDIKHKYLRIELPVGKKYTVTIDKRNTYPDGWGNTIVESTTNDIVVGGIYRTIAKKTNSSTEVSTLTFETSMPYVFIHIGRKNDNETFDQWFEKVLESFKTLQIEQNEQNTPFEQYQEDKTQILLDEPLMRLPDGTADEITLDGKLIRRVGKVILDGSENWSIDEFIAEKEKQITYKCNLSNLKEPTPSKYLNLICDKFPVTRTVIELDIEGISSYAMSFGSVLRLSIHKSKLSSSSLSHFKQWLQSNPTTVYYELTEPVVTDIVPPSLRIFKDGHLTFNTLVAPESSHLVQLNKSAQIERSIREVQGLNSRVGQLESFYDDMILETSHKLNLLTYDFEYTKESEDI